MLATCDTKSRIEPSLPPAAGFRVDDGVLKLWPGTPCSGVIRLTLIFDVGTTRGAEQVWIAPRPGATVERMDLLTTAKGSSPDTGGPLQVQQPLPADYDWTKADSLNFSVHGPKAFGARIDVAQVLRESPARPPESYLFSPRGWMDPSDVQRENQKLARLWEDVIALTPDVLEPVPADLQPFIASDPGQWACAPLDFVAAGDGDGPADIHPNAADHPVVTAADWYGQHFLDFGYLCNAPILRLWRTVHGDHDEITVDWRHQDDGQIGFTAGPSVRLCVPTAAYLEAVHTLDRELMAAMLHRVEELEHRSGLPCVELDLGLLRREHQDRTHWLANNLDRAPETDWDAVRHGAFHLLNEPPPAGT